MPRTVTALYDSRADAEAARGRLIADVKTHSTRIIARDTAAAVDTLDIDPKQLPDYRDAIRQGCHLLVAEIEPGQDPKRVITALEEAVGSSRQAQAPMAEAAAAVGVTARVEEPRVEARAPTPPAAAETFEEPKIETAKVERAPVQAAAIRQPEFEQRAALAVPQDEPRSPAPEPRDELRIGSPQMSPRRARVQSVIRETPTEEQVTLTAEQVDVDHRPSERRLSAEDLKAGGLLRERVFEIREMREEPVITKEAFVREEVIVRKTVRQRSETIRDTVRRTEVEVDELPVRLTPPVEEPRRGFFGGRPRR